MAIFSTNGMEINDLDSAPNGPGDIQKLANGVDLFYGRNVATIAALPAAGAFLGQRIWVVAAKMAVVWNGVSWDGAWVNIGTAGSSFGSGWTAGSLTPRARVIEGRVEIEGRFEKATWAAGEVVFTLPTGMRPDHLIPMIAYVAGGGAIVVLTIAANTGVVTTATSSTSGAANLNGFASLT